jgi:hypothetical protein
MRTAKVSQAIAVVASTAVSCAHCRKTPRGSSIGAADASARRRVGGLNTVTPCAVAWLKVAGVGVGVGVGVGGASESVPNSMNVGEGVATVGVAASVAGRVRESWNDKFVGRGEPAKTETVAVTVTDTDPTEELSTTGMDDGARTGGLEDGDMDGDADDDGDDNGVEVGDTNGGVWRSMHGAELASSTWNDYEERVRTDFSGMTRLGHRLQLAGQNKRGHCRQQPCNVSVRRK